MHDRIRAVHDGAIIVDALQISNWGESVFRNMRKGGLTAVNCTVSVLENFRQTIANIIEWDHMFNEYSDLIMPVRSTADIRAAKRAGKTGIIFGFQNTTAIEEDIDLLTIFHKRRCHRRNGISSLSSGRQRFHHRGFYGCHRIPG